MIKKRNILELIGKNRGKYSSCILTCYSFDFFFFEQRVLPTLRLANVSNVNILADGHYLELAQEHTTGKEFMYNKTYNFQPIYETGVFHPKIMLLTGPKHGLLLIGSGNITSSGLSTNDEIWGAFHLDNIGNENAPLFGAVWRYLTPYLDSTLGFIPQKIDWIKERSPWLSELPIEPNWISLDSIGITLAFISNTSQSSTFKRLTELVPNSKIEQLTVVSPYFDKSGYQLNQIIKHFQPGRTRCLVDNDSGLLPINLEEVVLSSIDFYNWKDCKSDFNGHYNRLHAKMVHFETQDEEYLLIGSANITMAAMGTLESSAANGEAGILLRRPKKQDSWITSLGIKIPKETIHLNRVQKLNVNDGSIEKINYKYRVLYSELSGKKITIYLDKDCLDPIVVNLINRNESISKLEYDLKENNILIVTVDDPENAFKISISIGEERVSNYSIIHRLESLLRGNPDPNQLKLDTLLDDDFPDGEGITDLLQYVDYNWADANNSATKINVKHSTSNFQKAPKTEEKKDFKILKADDFNKVSLESMLKQSGELSNSTVKIAEFLNIYTSGILGKNEDFTESTEQKLFEDQEQNGEGESSENKTNKSTTGSKEKYALLKYLKRIDEVYAKSLNPFYKTQSLKELPKEVINIRTISSILIALQLVLIKYGRKFTVITSETDELGESITRQESYIDNHLPVDNIKSLKGFLCNVLGKFFMLCSPGFKKYDYDILNQKIQISRSQLAIKSIYLILNTPWRKTEQPIKDILLLNCLFFTLGNNSEDEAEILKRVNDYRTISKYVIPQFKSNFEDLENRLFPGYTDWLNKFMNKEARLKYLIKPTSSLNTGDILFNSKIGFNIVKGFTEFDNIYKVHLIKPGYPYDESNFQMKYIQFGAKYVSFKA